MLPHPSINMLCHAPAQKTGAPMPAYPNFRPARPERGAFPLSRLGLKFGRFFWGIAWFSALPVGGGAKDNIYPMTTVDEFGPAMLALDERRRKFVLFRVHHQKNAWQAAKAAGYSDSTEGYLRVQGHRLMRDKSVIAAMREEAERHLDSVAVLAILGLGKLVESKNEKIRSAAIDSVLDRTGYARKVTQDIRVEHTDSRSTAAILGELRRLMPAAPLPMIEGKFEEVADGSQEG